MAILEEEILIGLVASNIKYYELLGYEIPRTKNKYGKLIVPKGTKILVAIKDLPNSSRVEVTKVCDDCENKVLNQRYDAIMAARNKGDGKDRCYICAQLLGSMHRINNIKYEDSFEYHAKLKNMEHLLKEFSTKNEKKPNEISFGSEKEYIWDCPNCKNEYSMNVQTRLNRNSSCPYCSNKKILIGYNDLWTTHPEVAKFLINPNRGYEIIKGTNEIEKFKCKDCGHEQSRRVVDVIRYGFSCVRCSDSIPYAEKFMMSVLNQLNIKYLTQKTFNWSNYKKYDFYFDSFIIETHGGQHYGKGFETIGGKTLEEEQENDKLKEKLAKENGIKHYIVIDCRYSEMEFIKNNIILSKLSNLFNLDKVNWLKAHEYALTSLIKLSCELWNNGIKSTNEIGKILKLSNTTIREYLKKGNLLSWCDYDPYEAMKNSSSIQGKKNGKKIIQLDKKGEFIKEWESIAEAQRQLNIGNISNACNGKLNICAGFKWMFKTDYDQTKLC